MQDLTPTGRVLNGVRSCIAAYRATVAQGSGFGGGVDAGLAQADVPGGGADVGPAVARLFAFVNVVDLNLFTRKDDRLEGVGQLVNVQDLHPLKLGHPIQVVICGEDGGFHRAGQLH